MKRRMISKLADKYLMNDSLIDSEGLYEIVFQIKECFNKQELERFERNAGRLTIIYPDGYEGSCNYYDAMEIIRQCYSEVDWFYIIVDMGALSHSEIVYDDYSIKWRW